MYLENPKYQNLFLKQAMIILGSAALKGGIKAGIRNQSTGESWKEIYRMSKINLKITEKMLKKFREDVQKLPNVIIEPYEIPKL